MCHTNNIIFKTEAEAIEALDHLREMIRQYGQVTLGALMSFADIEPNYEDCCVGWLNVDESNVVKTENGYILSMPPIEELGLEDEEASISFFEQHKRKFLIAGATIASAASLYLIGRAINRSEIGFKLKTKLIHKLMHSQLSKNKRGFITHYSIDEDHFPKEVITKIGDVIEEVLKDYEGIVEDT